jgi:hypothetical protein
VYVYGDTSYRPSPRRGRLSSRKMKTSAIMMRASAMSDAACAILRCERRNILKVNIFVRKVSLQFVDGQIGIPGFYRYSNYLQAFIVKIHYHILIRTACSPLFCRLGSLFIYIFLSSSWPLFSRIFTSSDGGQLVAFFPSLPSYPSHSLTHSLSVLRSLAL